MKIIPPLTDTQYEHVVTCLTFAIERYENRELGVTAAKWKAELEETLAAVKRADMPGAGQQMHRSKP